jgi:acyl-CoA synthetase (AMP-forming)/AMP-acid ligase II
MIVTGGENVYSAEVENALASHDAVEQAAVIGIPSEQWGEAVHAIVVVRDGATVTEDELREHCLTNLAKYKVPERWLFVEAFPRNSMGKIQRRDLPAMFS